MKAVCSGVRPLRPSFARAGPGPFRRGGGFVRIPSLRPAGWLPALLLLGCAGGSPAPSTVAPGGPTAGQEEVPGGGGVLQPEIQVAYTVVADSLPEDPAIEALVAPFRERMGEEIREVIGEAAVPLTEAVPEGTLGNFAADAILWAARRHASEPVHMAMTNNGGLRVPIPAGPITVSLMFELMPFENMLSVLTLSGEQVLELANSIAGKRGEPVSGFTFRIQEEEGNRVARDVRVGGEPVEPGAQYRLATNDYLANGGDDIPPLQNPLAREDLPILIRDAFIEYVREMGVIRAELEGRITGGAGE